MDGLSHITTPVPRTVSIRGRRLTISPLTLDMWGEVERRIVEKQPNPLAMVAKVAADLPEGLARELLGRAYDDARAGTRSTPEAEAAFLRSREGLALLLWVSTRVAEPSLTEEEVRELVWGCTPDDLERLSQSLDAMEGGPPGN